MTGFENSFALWPVFRNIISSSSSVLGFGHVGTVAARARLGMKESKTRDSDGVMLPSGSL